MLVMHYTHVCICTHRAHDAVAAGAAAAAHLRHKSAAYNQSSICIFHI